jgi:inhibitor of cysteine peptidase
MYIMNIGTCQSCGGTTGSGAFKLCRKCSNNQHKCEHCLAALGGEQPAAKDDKAPADKPAAVQLGESADGKTTTVPLGKTIVITLPGNITTGYSWKAVELKGDAVKADGEGTYVPKKHKPGMVGVGGASVFKYNAVKAGKATIKLAYARPWEKDKEPAKTFTAIIEVQEKDVEKEAKSK